MISQTDTLEQCYEFMLSFAARGLSAEGRDSEIHQSLKRAVNALRSLEGACEEAIIQSQLEPEEKYRAFFAVLIDDANRAATAVDIVLIQPTITAQVVDNLNASMHLRALLTDLFLVTEVLKPYQAQAVAN